MMTMTIPSRHHHGRSPRNKLWIKDFRMTEKMGPDGWLISICNMIHGPIHRLRVICKSFGSSLMLKNGRRNLPVCGFNFVLFVRLSCICRWIIRAGIRQPYIHTHIHTYIVQTICDSYQMLIVGDLFSFVLRRNLCSLMMHHHRVAVGKEKSGNWIKEETRNVTWKHGRQTQIIFWIRILHFVLVHINIYKFHLRRAMAADGDEKRTLDRNIILCASSRIHIYQRSSPSIWDDSGGCSDVMSK